MVSMGVTVTKAEVIRRSISLPAEMAEKIDAIALNRHVTGNRAIVDLLAAETKRLRKELARMTFGG